MTSFQRISIALIIFFATLELILPDEAYAFGKKEVEQKTTPNTTTPAVVVKPPLKVEVKSVQTVIKPDVTPKSVAKKKLDAKKQSKTKPALVAHKQVTKAAKPAEQQVAIATEKGEPTAGQQIGKQVEGGVDSVSGFFGKLKESINHPTTQSSCSAAQKAMNQC